MSKFINKLASSGNIVVITLAGLVIGVAALVIWLDTVYVQPERAFWATIENNLKTASITKVTQQQGLGQDIRQAQTTNFIGDISVSNDVDIVSAEDSVAVETLGFRDVDFLRYNKIALADEKLASVAQDAIGVWARQSDGSLEPQLVSEALVSSLVMHGNIEPQLRRELIDQLKQGAYQVDFDNVEVSSQNGNQVYSYSVNIAVDKYIPVLVQYLKNYKYDELATSIESSLGSGQIIPVKMTINPRARTLVSLSANNTTETYTAQGVKRFVPRPVTSVSYTDLENLINQ